MNYFTNKSISFTDSSLIQNRLCDIMSEEGVYFEETLGEYYQEELRDDSTSSGDDSTLESNKTNMPESNKTKKRVITYTKQNRRY